MTIVEAPQSRIKLTPAGSGGGRPHLRSADDRPREPTTWQTRQAQYDAAVCAWGIPNHSMLERVSAIELPVLVANGDSDPMILPRYSYLLAGLLPDARLTIYADSAHGFLFQHHSQFATDVNAFLDETTQGAMNDILVLPTGRSLRRASRASARRRAGRSLTTASEALSSRACLPNMRAP